MSDDHLSQTYDVLLHGLGLRDRLARGDRLNLAYEQGRLRALLGSAGQPAPWGSGGDAAGGSIALGYQEREFLGVRYALTCWLDELFADQWPEWNESKLEPALYQKMLRADNFWRQARAIEATPGAGGAAEPFLLCVLLGFRGSMADTPDQLREWVHATRSRVTRRLAKEPPALPERAPVSDVPPLLAADGYRRMTRALIAGVLAGVLVVAFLAVALFS